MTSLGTGFSRGGLILLLTAIALPVRAADSPAVAAGAPAAAPAPAAATGAPPAPGDASTPDSGAYTVRLRSLEKLRQVRLGGMNGMNRLHDLSLANSN